MIRKSYLFSKISRSAILLAIACVLAFSGSIVYAQHDHTMKTEMKKDMKMEMKSGMKSDSLKMKTMVRKGIIDLKKIDKNKDGKVFQDQMDWNVISDKAGTCPLCKMQLKEVTIEVAKENLVKNKFKVK